jgi:hypothetical protein
MSYEPRECDRTRKVERRDMSVLLESVMPDGVTPELADEVEVEMGVRDDPPAGLVVHVRLIRQGQWHVVDVWDSIEAYEAFVRDRLTPASQRVIERHGLFMDSAQLQDPEPQMSIDEIYSLLVGK